MAGKQCVRSIFKEITKTDRNMSNADRIIDKQMNERHRIEVNERKVN